LKELNVQTITLDNCSRENFIELLSQRIEKKDCAMIDALFGVGLDRNVEGFYAAVIDYIGAHKGLKAALDVPSGVDADSGAILGAAFKADFTVTFEPCKLGLMQNPAKSKRVGEIIVKDIGLCGASKLSPQKGGGDFYDLFRYMGADSHDWNSIGRGENALSLDSNDKFALAPDAADFARFFKAAKREDDADKTSFGRAAIIAGAEGYWGAAALCVKGALRAGAGLVTAVAPGKCAQIITTLHPQAMTKPYESSSEAMNDETRKLIARSNCLAIGCGLVFEGADDLVFGAVSALPEDRPLVLDAEALNAVSRDKERFAPLLRKRGRGKTIMLPHAAEAARLLDKRPEQINGDRMGSVREIAKKYNCVAVLKGASTLVSSEELCYLHDVGNSFMATGGAGDSLAGLVCGLICRGFPPLFSACAAVYAHGKAGDDLLKKSPRAMIDPSDLCDAAGEIFAQWELS